MSSFWFIIKQQWTIEEISIFKNNSHLERRAGLSRHNFERNPPRDHPCQVWFTLVQGFQRRRFKCESLRRTTVAKWWQKLTWPLARWAKKRGKWFWQKCAEWDISVTGTHFLAFQMEHPYRTAINHVIEYDDLSSSQNLPDTFGNDVNKYIFLYKYTSYLDAIIYFMWLSYFSLQILQSLILTVFTSWFSKGYLNNF
jgi:hypothetical protein